MSITVGQKTEAAPLLELADVRTYLRVDSDDDDALIQHLIMSAGVEAENITHRIIAQRTYLITCWGGITGTMTIPLIPCTEVKVMADAAGTIQISPSLYTLSYTASRPAGDADTIAITPSSTPVDGSAFPAGTVWLETVCGYATVPEPILQWVRVRVATLYEQRENFTIGSNFQEFSHNFSDSLLDDYVIHGGF